MILRLRRPWRVVGGPASRRSSLLPSSVKVRQALTVGNRMSCRNFPSMLLLWSLLCGSGTAGLP